MKIEQKDLFEQSFMKRFLTNHLKIENTEYLDMNKIKCNLFDKIDKNNSEEDAIQEIFNLSNNDDINTETLMTHKIYEITNNTDIRIRDNNSFHKLNKKNEKIFKLKKITKKLGRRKHNDSQLYSINANHSKFKEDNIVSKIKIYFTNSIMRYINKKYSEYTGVKSKKLLVKIKPNFTKVWTKKDNQEYLAKTIKDIFSEELSTKCTRYPCNYNIKQIKKVIHKSKPKDVINILNKTVKEMYEIYIGKNEKIPELNLENDLVFIEKRNGKEYMEEYKKIAFNLIEIINKKGATAYGIGMCMVRITNAILEDKKIILPVSSWDAKNKICISTPAIVGRRGVLFRSVRNKIFIPLNDEEKQKLTNSINIIKEACHNIED